jgi:predicted metal-dependent hydrolase
VTSADPGSAPGVRQAASTIVLDGRRIEYRVRQNARSRGIRITIDPKLGLVVSVPLATRRGWARPEPRIEGFLHERRSWVLRHLDGLARDRARVRALGGTRDGSLVLYRGEPHRLRVVPGALRGRRSAVERSGGDAEDELVVSLATGDRRPLDRILREWFRERATEAIAASIAAHAPSLGVRPAQVDVRDPKTRWGSASRTGRIMFSWRLVLAPSPSLESVVVHELAHLRVFGHGPAFWKLVAARWPTHLADRAWLRRNSHALHEMLETSPADA